MCNSIKAIMSEMDKADSQLPYFVSRCSWVCKLNECSAVKANRVTDIKTNAISPHIVAITG